MEILITLITVWLLSPIPLLIIAICLGSKSKKLNEQINQLQEENARLKHGISNAPDINIANAPNESEAEPVKVEQPTAFQEKIPEPQNTKPLPQEQPVTNTESRYNMPYYGTKSNAPSPAPQSVYNSRTAPTENTRKVSSINIMLIIGALFIIISGLIFATTTWEFLSSGIRAVVIFSFSAVFFAVSSLAERKFNLPKTGVLFYTLGSTFLPITLIAAGYFKVFGEWFSLYGGGRALLLALTFAALSAVCVKGSCDYKSKAFSWCGLISFSAAVCSLIFQFTQDNNAAAALIISLYSFAALFICEILSKKQSERFGVLLSQLNTFAAVNTFILSISGIITACSKDSNGIISLIACIIFAAGYLKSSFTEKNAFSGAIPFTVLIAFGMFAAFSPDNFRDVTCTVTLISVIPAALSLMGLIPEKLRGALKLLSNFGAVIALIFCAIAAFAAEPSWLTLGAYVILAAEILVLGLIHKNESNGKAMLNLFPAACAVIALFLSRLILGYAELPNKLLYTVLIFTVLTAVFQVLFIFVFGKHIRRAASDVVFAFSNGFAMFFVLSESSDSPWLVLVSCLVTVGTMLLPAFDKEKPWKNTLFSSAAMIWSGFLALPLSQLTASSLQLSHGVNLTITLTLLSLVLTAVSVSVTFLCKNKSTDTTLSVILRLILSAYFIILAVSGDAFISPVLFVITAICLFRGIKLKNNAEFAISNFLAIILSGLIAYDVNRQFEFEHIILFMCGMAAVIYILCIFVHGNGGSFEKISSIFSRYGMLVLTSLSLYYLSVDGSPFSMAYTLIALMFFLLTATAFYNSRFTVPLILPFILFYTAAVNTLEEFFISSGYFVTYREYDSCPVLNYQNFSPTAIFTAVLILISIAFSYILHKDYVIGKENRKMPDCFAIARFVGIAVYFNAALGDNDEWFSIWLTAACLLSLCRKKQDYLFRRWIYTVVLTAPVIAWIFQPFFELPDVIELELKILPVLIYCCVIRLLWKEKLAVIDNITFGVYVFSYLILFGDALSSGLIADGLIIVITSLILLVFSFIVKKKKWFILSVTVLLTATLFMSRSFWASLAWWVYLLAAGLILIAIGAANELKKQSAAKENKSEFEKKVTRFMSEWTW